MKNEILQKKPEKGLVRVLLSSGLGTGSEDCMSVEMYDSLNDNGALKGTVFVCDQGWTAADVFVYGYYSYSYNYSYNDNEYEYGNTTTEDPGNVHGGGGETSGPSVSSPETQPGNAFNCSSVTAQKAKDARRVIDSPYTSYVGGTGNISIVSNDAYYQTQMLRAMAGTTSVENSFSINYDPGIDYYFPYKDRDGTIFNSGTKNGVKMKYTENTVYVGHTHPAGTNAAPSPRDIEGTIRTIKGQLDDIYSRGLNENDYRLIQGNLVVSNSGAEYLIVVDNVSATKGFLLDPDIAYFWIDETSTSPTFNEGTRWKEMYDETHAKLKAAGYSENDAQAFALAYVLENENMGLKLMQRNSKANEFKELKTSKDPSGNYHPKLCQSN